ncbi:MAG TPA: hypothetical protein VFG76_02370, partial [Candidatus Polarisedimenticolia bacterium]|nr:hypothetical protein [Candidatus Polarisedimenticolia bacterium]
FQAAVRKGIDFVGRVAEDGGILALTDQFSETFAYIGGIAPRYLVLDSVLRDLESRYGERVWYPRGRELALWLDLRHQAKVTWRQTAAGVDVEVEPPAEWDRAAAEGLADTTLIVHLPARFGEVANVVLQDHAGGTRRLDSASYWRVDHSLAIVFPVAGKVRLHITRAGG